MESIRKAAMYTSVMPQHKAVGKMNYNNIELDERKLGPLKAHFDLLRGLGEVRATQTISDMVDETTMWNSPCEEAHDKIFLPICMEYRQCYKCYVASFGYKAQSTKVEDSLYHLGRRGRGLTRVSLSLFQRTEITGESITTI